MPFNTLFSWLIKKRIHQIDLFKKYPLEVQNEVFTKLISSAIYTEFGFQNNFFRVKNYETFKEFVPLQEYEGIKKM